MNCLMQFLIESQVKIVSSCVDTLVLNCYPTNGSFEIEPRKMPVELREELEQLKALAQEAEEPVTTRFVFNGANLHMQAKGGDGFNWILRNGSIALAVNRSAKMQLLAQVRCSSQYLQSTRDLGKVICEVHMFLISIFGQLISLQPSAVDLAVDVVGLDLGSVHDVKKHFVTRAQLTGEMPGLPSDGMIDGPDQIKERWGRLTGLPFGARKAPLSALIYDKTHEIKYNSPEKGYMWDIWQHEAEKQGFCLLPTAKVWRIEIRYRRAALGEMKQEGVFHGIDDAYRLEDHLSGLWSYAVGHVGGGADGLPDGWLRYIIPTDDKNRSRWPVHPDWQVIQSAFAPAAASAEEIEDKPQVEEEEERANGLDEVASQPQPVNFEPYVRERKRQVNMRRLVAQIAGCTITAQAWREDEDEGVEPDISDTFQFLYGEIEAYLVEKERDFSQLVHKKRVLYDLETTSGETGVAA
jgi:hypothetical protein